MGMLFWKDIPTKFKVVDKTAYTRSVYVCPKCDNDMSGNMFQNMLGFHKHYVGIIYSIECPKCFTKFGSHAPDYYLECLGDTIEEGENIHHKKEE